MLIGCSLGISALALWLGRRLTPAQDSPQRWAADGADRRHLTAAA